MHEFLSRFENANDVQVFDDSFAKEDLVSEMSSIASLAARYPVSRDNR